MHGVQNGGLRPRRRRRRQLNSRGERRAVRQALTGAKLYLAGEFPSLKAAAEAVGVSVRYVHAGVILLQAENADLLAQVLAGELLMLAAAKEAKPVAKAIAAYKAMTEADKKAFEAATGATTDLFVHSDPSKWATAAAPLGPEVIWNQMVLPLLNADKGTASTNP